MTSGAALLLDFGASRIKAALYDLTSNTFLAGRDAPAPEPVFGADGAVEIPAAAYGQILDGLLDDLLKNAPQPAIACLTAEMHGFLLADADGKALTPYISWRDERAARGGTLERLAGESADFRAITGMRLKPGLPFVTLVHMAQRGQIPAGARFLSLPEWIALSRGQGAQSVDETMAAASGLYDIERKSWSDILRGKLPKLTFNTVIDGSAKPVGQLRVGNKDIPLFGGIGDLQAAVLGSGAREGQSLCLNLGTGSQINTIGITAAGTNAELRPFFGGKRLTTISHIPAGRALRAFECFFDGGFWPLVSSLAAEEILAAPLTIDLNIFAGAWRWDKGGSIAGITETNFTPRMLAASAIHALAAQYPEAIAIIDPRKQIPAVRLAGGLARRIPVLRDVLASLTGREIEAPSSQEETLLGLAAIAGPIKTT